MLRVVVVGVGGGIGVLGDILLKYFLHSQEDMSGVADITSKQTGTSCISINSMLSSACWNTPHYSICELAKTSVYQHFLASDLVISSGKVYDLNSTNHFVESASTHIAVMHVNAPVNGWACNRH